MTALRALANHPADLIGAGLIVFGLAFVVLQRDRSNRWLEVVAVLSGIFGLVIILAGIAIKALLSI